MYQAKNNCWLSSQYFFIECVLICLLIVLVNIALVRNKFLQSETLLIRRQSLFTFSSHDLGKFGHCPVDVRWQVRPLKQAIIG